jgi:hypothetical protein
MATMVTYVCAFCSFKQNFQKQIDERECLTCRRWGICVLHHRASVESPHRTIQGKDFRAKCRQLSNALQRIRTRNTTSARRRTAQATTQTLNMIGGYVCPSQQSANSIAAILLVVYYANDGLPCSDFQPTFLHASSCMVTFESLSLLGQPGTVIPHKHAVHAGQAALHMRVLRITD